MSQLIQAEVLDNGHNGQITVNFQQNYGQFSMEFNQRGVGKNKMPLWYAKCQWK